MDPLAQLAALWADVSSHNWLMAGGLGVYLLVAFFKQGYVSTWLAAKVPSHYLPVLSLAAGVVSASAMAVAHGGTWHQALVDGVQAAAGATLIHQLGVEGLMGGVEWLVDRMPAPPVAPPAKAA